NAYSFTTRIASSTVVGSGIVGPDASAASCFLGTSLTASVIFVARPAAAANRPPFTAEKCRLTFPKSAIGAPQVTSAEYSFSTSPRRARQSSGNSTTPDPPPDSQKNTMAFPSPLPSVDKIASAARQLSRFGIGCPPTKYSTPSTRCDAAGGVGALTTPPN